MTTIDRRATVAATAVLALAAMPAAASGATVSVPACSLFVAGERTVQVRGSGFTPGSQVTLRADGQALGTAIADAGGTIGAETVGPGFSSAARNVQSFDLTAEDAAGTTATTTLRMTRLNATLPARARPTSRVTFRVFGFEPGKTVYLHVRRAGRPQGSFRIGRADSPCGAARTRLRYMPVTGYRTGTYDYTFQAARRYDPDAPRVRLRVEVVRRRPGGS